jgi:hypothetical protein
MLRPTLSPFAALILLALGFTIPCLYELIIHRTLHGLILTLISLVLISALIILKILWRPRS